METLLNLTYLLMDLTRMVNPTLHRHSRDLARMCEKVARQMAWPEEEVRTVFLGALFHDIGYLATPRDLGFENRRVDSPRLPDLVAGHPACGAQVLARVEALHHIIPIVRHHHEHMDGSGFPDGLKGEAIPSHARLVAAVHEYMLLRQGHGTTQPMAEAEAREVVSEDAGLLWDPVVVQALMEVLAEEPREE